jgi:hypothetical protein
MAAYTTIDNPGLYFNTVLYTGDGSGATVSGVGFQPDLNWTKCRSDNLNHALTDAVRGVQKTIYSNSESEADDVSNGLTAFNSDGYVHGDHSLWSTNTETYVSWNWKANGSGSSDTNGSVNSIATSANTTSGFSITHFNLSGESGEETVGHGLGVAPDFIIAKTGLDKSGNSIWWVYHKDLSSASYYLSLAGNGAQASESQAWGGTAPTSTVFTVGDAGGWGTYKTVAYCFAGKQGYCKTFSYEGNGNADGTFVYLGFRPAWLMVKPIDSADNWVNFDNKRLGFNSSVSPYSLHANKNFVETTDTGQLDFLSNGFKIRNSGNTVNRASTFVGIAFAEAPFVNSNGVPCNAR